MDSEKQPEQGSTQEQLNAASPIDLIFHAPDLSALAEQEPARRQPVQHKESSSEDTTEQSSSTTPASRRRHRRGRGDVEETTPAEHTESKTDEVSSDDAATQAPDQQLRRRERDDEDVPEMEVPGEDVVSRRRRRRRRGDLDIELDGGTETDPPNTITRVRAPRTKTDVPTGPTTVTSVKGSTRLEAKRQRRRETRESNRRGRGLSEAEFLARRESVDRQMMVRQREGRIQIAVLEDGVLAEHFVSHTTQDSLIGNVYLGKVQNVLPSMEAAFVDIGRNRNAVLYAGEVNWDASGLDGQPRKIENALKSGDSVLVQVTKDPVGHKGARLTSQVSMPGRYLVYVPGASMTGISRKLPDNERARLKKVLKDNMPDNAGVIVRTAAEGASEEELINDINRLHAKWGDIQAQADAPKTLAPELLYSEPDLTIKVVRDVFNEDFSKMVIQGEEAWDNIEAYVTYVAPNLLDRLEKWDEENDVFAGFRIDEQLIKALDRKVFLPSGGSLVIDRTEAMTVVDVNTGKFTGSGGNLEETVTKNNLEAAEEIARQLRLRDIGGIIVIDFIDMVLESNRDLVLRRLIECLGRDRTKHQVAEVTSLGLVQMTRKRMGTGLIEVFSEVCNECAGRGIITHSEPLENRKSYTSTGEVHAPERSRSSRSERRRRSREKSQEQHLPQEEAEPQDDQQAEKTRVALANIAAATVPGVDESQESSQEKDVTGTPTITIGGEAVEVPRGSSRPETGKAQELDRLSDAIGTKASSDVASTEGDSGGRKPRQRRQGRRVSRSHDQTEQNQAVVNKAPVQAEPISPQQPAIDHSKVQLHDYDQPKPIVRRSKTAITAKPADNVGTKAKSNEPKIFGVGVSASSMKNE